MLPSCKCLAYACIIAIRQWSQLGTSGSQIEAREGMTTVWHGSCHICCAQPQIIDVMQVTKHVDLPMSVVYIVQLLTFGGGFFGITYGILSASWDPMREGSLLGFTEFKANLPLILERVKSRGGKGRV